MNNIFMHHIKSEEFRIWREKKRIKRKRERKIQLKKEKLTRINQILIQFKKKRAFEKMKLVYYIERKKEKREEQIEKQREKQRENEKIEVYEQVDHTFKKLGLYVPYAIERWIMYDD